MASRPIIPSYKWLPQVVSLAFLLSPFIPSCISSNPFSILAQNSQKNTQLPQIYTIEVVNEYPHDSGAFTEGLVYGGNNTLYESTGYCGKSSVRRVELQTGKVEALRKMASSDFGEGLALLGERLYQLTYLQKTGFIYDRRTLSKLANFTHQMNDGWGLASDGKTLFGSDGSSTLYQIDPQTMKVIGKQNIKYNDHEVYYLNELEYVNGEVWANVAQTDCIVRISPGDGAVLGWILLPILRESLVLAGAIHIYDDLNGIAWDSHEERIFVTGKYWPKLFEITVHPTKELFPGTIEALCIAVPAGSEV